MQFVVRIFLTFVLTFLSGWPQQVQAETVQAWVERFSGSGTQFDDAVAVAADPAGNVAVTGRLAVTQSNQNFDALTIKYNGISGAMLWKVQRDGAGRGHDQGRAVAMDPAGNVFVTGFLTGTTTSQDLFVAKYATANGALLWERIITQPQQAGDGGNAIAVDSNGDVFVTGYNYFFNRDTDYYTAKFRGSDGVTLWEKTKDGTFIGNGDVATALVLDGAGNAIVTGYSYSSNGTRDYLTIKYAGGDGTELWVQRYNGSTGGEDRAYSVAVAPNGDVAVTGLSDNAARNNDYATVKYAGTNGTQLWAQRYDAAGQTDNAWAVAMDAGGNVFVTGSSYRNATSGGKDIYTAKYDSGTGTVLWERRHIGAGDGFDEGCGIIVDAAGDAFITGTSDLLPAATGPDYYTAKYGGSDGAILWEKYYDGPAQQSEAMNGGNGRPIVMLPDQGIVITGRSTGVSTYQDYTTIKYAQDAPPTVVTGAATNVTPASATVSATVTANYADTTPSFLYGTTDAYGSTAEALPSPVTGKTPATVSASLTGLQPHTAYHFTIRGINSAGMNVGTDATFTTANRVPVANGETVELPLDHFNVKANDTDADGDALTVSAVGAAAHGLVTLHDDNTVSYTPGATFTGTDSFTYTVRDDFGGSTTGTVSLKDTTAPVITFTPPPQSVGTGNNPTAPLPDVTGLVLATDNVAVFAKTQAPLAGMPRSPGSYPVIVTVTDASGNDSETTVIVTVSDDTPPGISAPAGDFTPLSITTGVNATVPLPDYRAQAVTADNIGVTNVTQSPAEGGPRTAGITAVTLTAHDAAGNTTDLSFTVTVLDGTKPEIAAPPGGFTPLALVADADGTVAMPDYAGQAVTSDNVGVSIVTQIPTVGSLQLFGETVVTLTAHDAAGNTRALSFTVMTTLDGPAINPLAATGTPVPGAGVDARIPADAKFTKFGLPAVSDLREVCFLGKWKAGRTLGSGVFAGSPPALLVAAGEDAPGVLGAKFKVIRDPLLAPDGTLAFSATVKGTGIKATQDQGVWMIAGGVPTMVLREGFQIPGAPAGFVLKSVTGLSLRNGELLTVAKLAPARGSITALNDMVLLRVTTAGATVLLQKNDLLDLADGFPAAKITSLSALLPAAGSPAHGRWHADGAAAAQVKLANGRQVALSLAADGSVTRAIGIGQGVTNLADSVVFLSLNLPAIETSGHGAVVRGTLIGIEIPGLPPVVTTMDDSILAHSPDAGTGYAMFAREGSPAAGAGEAVFAKFSDPLVNDGGAVAFIGTLAGKGVVPENNTGLWWGPPEDLALLARTNFFAPGVDGQPTTARWNSFVSVALPSGPDAGPVFLARVRGPGVTARNNTGLWAVDSTGKLRRLLRTGDVVNGNAVVGIHALAGAPGSLGASRGFNERGTVATRVTMARGAQAILRIDVPVGETRITSLDQLE